MTFNLSDFEIFAVYLIRGFAVLRILQRAGFLSTQGPKGYKHHGLQILAYIVIMVIAEDIVDVVTAMSKIFK